MNRRSQGVRAIALVAAAAVSLIALSGFALGQASAASAVSARGAGGAWTPLGGWLGNYYNEITGKYVYCVDLWSDDMASGGDGEQAEVIGAAAGGALGGTREITGAELQMMNYAVSVHGQTDDPIAAAAVAAYVWSLTSTSNYGDGGAYIAGPHAAEIRLRYDEISADTATHHNSGAGGSGDLAIQTDPTNHYMGSLQLTNLVPADVLGSVQLHNAVFADSGLSTRFGLSGDTSLAIVAVPPTDSSEYIVGAEAAFTAQVAPRFEANVRLHSDTEQRSVGPGSTSSVVNYVLNGADASPRNTLFRPVVGTMVSSRFVQPGEPFVDRLAFSTQADASGLNHPWYRDQTGRFVPVTAIGTLYGPFLEQPGESDLPPAGAPIAAHEIAVTTSPEHAASIEYTAQSDQVARDAGFYTWVWRISAEEQAEDTRIHLPHNYNFQDRFGQVVETSITPSKLEISTQLTDSVIEVGGSVADEVTVTTSNGGWLQTLGVNVPATLTGTAYFSETVPEPSAEAPADAEIIGELSLVADGPGIFVSDAFEVPMRVGYVTFQWCLREAAQPSEFQGLLAESCDDFGLPSETVQVRAPHVSVPSAPAEKALQLAATGADSLPISPFSMGAATVLLGSGFIGMGAGLALRRAQRRRG